MGIFTRDNEELLSYDADAFYYFAATMLLATLIPWTFVLSRRLAAPRPPEASDYDARGSAPKGAKVRRCATAAMEAKRQHALQQARSWRNRLKGGRGIQLVAVVALWMSLGAVVWKLKDTPPELRRFDPYKILGIEPGADIRDIKKAYRVKSLQHHPDKDRENPLAPVMFQQVTKAYAALTDEGARKNYAKYGNPDGPTQMKVGIALHPALLVSKESQLTTLCLFFCVLFIVPFSVVCCCLRGSQLSAGGVSQETLRTYNAIVDIEARAVDGPGFLAASVEARRHATSDIRDVVKAMTEFRPLPLMPGLVIEIRGLADLAGRRGVLRRPLNPMVWEVEVWPPTGPPEKPEQCEIRPLPRPALAPLEPRLPCPFSDPPIRRTAALVWAHMWRLHRHMSPLVQAELAAVLRESVKLGRAMVSVAAHGHGDRSGFFEVVREMVAFRRCLVQALDLGSSPLLQLPHVASVPANAPDFREVINGGADTLCDLLKLNAEQRLDVQAFCRHLPRVELSCEVQVSDEENIAEGDMATLTVTLTRTNLEEGEAAGPVHAPLFPGPKFEEWWLLVYDDRTRRLITADVILGTGREEKSKINFMVPRAGSFRWSVHALCDSYAGLDVHCPVPFVALKKAEVDKGIFIHPEDMQIKTLFEEIMEGLQQDEQDSDSEDEEPKKVAEEEAAEKKKKKAEDEPGSSEDETMPTGEPEGTWFRVICPRGATIFREPREDLEVRLGTVPCGAPLRGFEDDRPEGWIELAWGGGAWLRTGPAVTEQMLAGQVPMEPENLVQQTERLGALLEQQLRMVVQTHTPMPYLRRWMRLTQVEVTAEDMLQVREMDDLRSRMFVEELVRKRVGDERFDQLLDEAEVLAAKRKQRLSKALGFFNSPGNIIWHVTPNGMVKGLHLDGNRIRDRVEATADGIQIGPFVLDETRPCSCIHWLRRDDPTKAWNWSPERSLQARVRLGTPEGGY